MLFREKNNFVCLLVPLFRHDMTNKIFVQANSFYLLKIMGRLGEIVKND
jgi:hypothetical protein